MNVYRERSVQKAFNFTDDDLLDNRRGDLSETQRSSMKRDARTYSIAILVIFAVLTLMAVFSSGDGPDAAFLCVVVPVFAIGILGTLSYLREIDQARAQRVIGQSHLGSGFLPYNPPLTDDQLKLFGMNRGRSPRSYDMVVGNVHFRLTHEQYNALTPDNYSVYYMVNRVTRATRILSLEQINLDGLGPADRTPAASAPFITSGGYDDAPDQPGSLRG